MTAAVLRESEGCRSARRRTSSTGCARFCGSASSRGWSDRISRRRRCWRGGVRARRCRGGSAARTLARCLCSCDRRQALGRRDYAIIITLLRLGLRRSELAGLRLDDIDWRAGELVVRGKGAREDRLPLPADVGEAIARICGAGGRAAAGGRCSCGPRRRIEPIASGTVASTCVGRAGAPGSRRSGRIGCGTRRRARWSRANVPLVRIGQVLRHRSLQSTAIYARVDRRAAATVGGAVARRCAAMSGLQAARR